MSNFKYVVFRVMQPDEEEFELGPIYYGWSHSKKIVKAFIKQRGKNKYVYKEMTDEDIECANFSGYSKQDDSMIKLLMLPSKLDGKKYPLFITDQESKQVEVGIHMYFRDLSSFENYKSNRHELIILYCNLKDEAKQVLEDIGFVPKELDDHGYFESESIFTCLENEIECLLDDAYSRNDYDMIDLPFNESPEDVKYTPKGQLFLNSIHSHICYSLEAYIKILKDEF